MTCTCPKEHVIWHNDHAPPRWVAIFSEWPGDMRTLDDVNKCLKDGVSSAEGDDPPFKYLGTHIVTATKVEDSMTSYGKPGYRMVRNADTYLVFYAKTVGAGPVLCGNPADKGRRPADWPKLCATGAVVPSLQVAKKQRVTPLEAAKAKKVT